MKDFSKYYDQTVRLECNDGQIIKGALIEWTSELDNEPNPESVTLRAEDGALIEIYVSDIKSVKAA